MDAIWVLQCGDIPYSYHEDAFVLIQQVQRTFPDKMWEQVNPLVWHMVEGAWKITKIEREVLSNTEAAQS